MSADRDTAYQASNGIPQVLTVVYACRQTSDPAWQLSCDYATPSQKDFLLLKFLQ